VRRIATLLAAACLCTACVGGALRSDAKAPDLYRLEGPAAEPGGTALPLAIAVLRPRAPSSLDTERIAIRTPGHGFDYLAGARWADPAPQILQQLLVGALTAEAHFATAVASPSRVPVDLLVDVEVGHFEADYSKADAPPTIVVEFSVNVVDVRSGRREGSFRSAASVPAARNDRTAVVAAFEQAANQAVGEAARRVAAAATTKP
jgi:cholesterol transport system auxiliary component